MTTAPSDFVENEASAVLGRAIPSPAEITKGVVEAKQVKVEVSQVPTRAGGNALMDLIKSELTSFPFSRISLHRPTRLRH